MPVTITVEIVDRATRQSVELVVTADPSIAVATLLEQAVEVMSPLGTQARRVAVDGRLVHREASLSAAGVRAGSLIELLAGTASASVPVTPGSVPGLAEVRVIGGPGAGRVHRLPLGVTTIGIAPAVLDKAYAAGDPVQHVVVTDPPDSLVRLWVSAGADGTVRYRVEPAADEQAWPVGGVVSLGPVTLELGEVSAPEAHAVPAPEQLALDVNRPPRILPPRTERGVTLPARPQPRAGRRLPWAAVLAPAALAVPLALLFGPHYLIFAVFSPVLALAQWGFDRRTGRKDGRTSLAAWRRQRAELVAEVDDLLTTEARQRRDEAPDAARLLLLALGPGARLWERRATDPDHLLLRVGLAELPPRARIDDRDAGAEPDSTEEQRPRTTVTDVPAEITLDGVVGIAGTSVAGEDTATRVGGWLLAQVALLHSPEDVRVVVLATGPQAERRWRWTRWLPHLRAGAGSTALAVGTDAETVGRRVAELTALVTARRGSRSGVGAMGSENGWSDVVLVLDGARQLRSLPAVVALLRDGPAVGLRVICLETEATRLPVECTTVIELVGPTEALIRTSGRDDVPQVRVDLVEAVWLEEVARALAPLRESRSVEAESAIPERVRLLDLLPALIGADGRPVPDRIRHGWAAGPHYGPPRVPLGVGFDGPMSLDLTRDGPHALIAGTTGSGKSELLQTLVVSAALAHPPERLSFVLVDYKGGAAFAGCADLPHTVGLVTDLDGHLVQRALSSLGAELKRRERILAGAGAKDLEDYLARTSGVDAPHIARLVIVVDEFAALAAELPDFVIGLVGIAQRGRSLGVHLVLATQRPSGAVSADIRANTALRICLRVTDEADSRDVIDSPDAAHIARNTPGRALVSTGQSTLMPFQTARVAGPFGGDETGMEARLVMRPFDWQAAGRPESGATATVVAPAAGVTDLDVLVAAIRAAGEGQPLPPRPWLPALPADVRVGQLGRPLEPEGDPAVSWALDDLPAQQGQQPHVFSPGRSGHLYIVGTSGAGRSTALRTLAASLAAVYPTRDLHLYGLDCGNGALNPLITLPNVGTVVSRTDTTRAERLLDRLAEEIARRQAVLARRAHADINEHRRNTAASVPERLPHVVLLIDRWEGFTATLGELDGGRVTETVLHLLREGLGVGIQVVISGDRSLLLGRMAALVENKLLLRLADRSDYPLAGVPTRSLPAEMPVGRGVWAPTSSDQPPVEAQVALMGPGAGSADSAERAHGADQAAAVTALGAWTHERDADTPAGKRPFTLAPLPATISTAAVGSTFKAAGPLHVPFGIGGDDLDQLGIDLSGAPVAVVAGPPRSGRTTALRFIAAHAMTVGTPLLVISPRHSELVDDVAAGVERGRPVGAHVGPDGEALTETLRALPPESIVLIDDGDQLREGPLAPVLLAVVKQAREKQWGVVTASDTSHLAGTLTGWLPETRRHRQGLLLSPVSLSDGDALGHRLQRSQLLARPHPGRGLLTTADRGLLAVQVPHSGL